MKRSSAMILALALGLSVGGVASAQTVGYNIRTGDVWVDTRLDEINDYGRRYRDPFIDEMAGYYGAPRPLLVELLDERRWAPADVYYACAIAHALGVPCRDIVRDYERNRGQGWGAVAKRHGIKPGSPAFHALKRGTLGTYERWGYPITLERRERVDWSRHGPGRSNAAGRGNEPRGHGPHRQDHDRGQGQGKGQDKGKGQDEGKGKGQDRDKGKGKP